VLWPTAAPFRHIDCAIGSCHPGRMPFFANRGSGNNLAKSAVIFSNLKVAGQKADEALRDYPSAIRMGNELSFTRS
jgi:hypothetical protein